MCNPLRETRHRVARTLPTPDLVMPMRSTLRISAALLLFGTISLPAAAQSPAPVVRDTAVFAGGCFWGVEGVFEHVNGVFAVVSGFAGGNVPSPTYEQVASGQTGHAESVQVIFDPSVISYADLLKIFFTVAHDPTEVDRQGPDVGPQYRSLVIYRTKAQRDAAKAYIKELTAAKAFPHEIATEVVGLDGFYRAEPFHQRYMQYHPDSPYIIENDAPKLVQLKKLYPAWYRDSWSPPITRAK